MNHAHSLVRTSCSAARRKTLSIDRLEALTDDMWQEYRRQKVQALMSERERAVLNGIMRGDRDREIAAHLGVSHSVVRQSGVTLRRKLNAKSRTDLAMRALELGFAIELLQGDR